MSYADFQKYHKKISGIRNKMPGYIPSPEDVERMIAYTKKPRLYLQNVPVTSGRKYEYESRIKFVKGGRLGEPCIKEEHISMYLLLILKTAKPKDQKGRDNLEYIDKRLKELLLTDDTNTEVGSA